MPVKKKTKGVLVYSFTYSLLLLSSFALANKIENYAL